MRVGPHSGISVLCEDKERTMFLSLHHVQTLQEGSHLHARWKMPSMEPKLSSILILDFSASAQFGNSYLA
jgi:hypothetical protein